MLETILKTGRLAIRQLTRSPLYTSMHAEKHSLWLVHMSSVVSFELLMWQLGLRGKVVRTITSDSKVQCPLDRVNRQFNANTPNQLWVSDFNYVRLGRVG